LPLVLTQTLEATLCNVPIKAPQQTFLCRICLENVPVASKAVLLDCGVDAHATCRECLRMYLHLRVADGRVEELCCPCAHDEEGGCKASVREEELQQWLSPEAYEKSKRFLQMRANPHLRACPSCNQLLSPEVKEDGTVVAEMYCLDCDVHFCHHHSNAHDRGPQACAEYERSCLRQQLRNAGLYGARACPRCGAMTQKTSGCNHMTCNCKAHWCWLCGRQLENVGWHYNPANPHGCMQFQNEVKSRHGAKLMVVCKIFSFPAMLASIVFLILFALSLVATLFLPFCFCCKEIGFKVWVITAAIITGTPFFVFSVLWCIVGGLFWLIIVPCGAGETHLQFLVGVPVMMTLALCEAIVEAGRAPRVAQ